MTVLSFRTTPVEDIDAYEAERATRPQARLKAAAVTAGKASAQAAKRGAWAATCRLGRGLADLPADVVTYLGGYDLVDDVEAAPAGDPTTKARLHREQAISVRRANAVTFVLLVAAWLLAGWTSLAHVATSAGNAVAGWALVAVIYLALALALTVTTGHAAKGRTRTGWAWPVRLSLVLFVSVGNVLAHLVLGMSLGWARAALVAALAVWVWWGAKDGDAFDVHPTAQSSSGVVEPESRESSIVAAILREVPRLAAEGANLTYVDPGVMPLAGGKAWRLGIDTGGPSSEPIVAARDGIASRIGLSASRLILERDPDRGRLLTMTAITGDVWGPPTPSPLIRVEQVRFGRDPLPYGRTFTQEDIDLPLFDMHYLIGGMPRKGKSTSCYPIWAAAALDPLAPIWVIDGGEVDTIALKNHGIARRWTTDPVEAVDVLDEITAEVERRQSLLGKAELKRPNAEFYAEHAISDGLFVFDEFASFTNGADRKLAASTTAKLVSILQRAPKTHIHVVMSTQSPSAKAFDTDGRGVIPGRAALLCDGPEMSNKILGSGMTGRGYDASTLPDVKGVQWLKLPSGMHLMRPHLITDDEMGDILRRAAVLRGAATHTRTSQVPPLLAGALALLRHQDVASMRSAEIVGRLVEAGHELPPGIRGQQVLAAELVKFDVQSVQQWSDGGKAHYVRSELERAVAEIENAA